MSKRTKRNNRRDGLKQEGHRTWDELVQPPALPGPKPRAGSYYVDMSDVPTPDELAVQDPTPDTFKGKSRWQRRQERKVAKARLRKYRLTGQL